MKLEVDSFDYVSIVLLVFQIIVPLLNLLLKNFIYNEQDFENKYHLMENTFSDKMQYGLRNIVRSYFREDGILSLEEPNNKDHFENYCNSTMKMVAVLSSVLILKKCILPLASIFY